MCVCISVCACAYISPKSCKWLSESSIYFVIHFIHEYYGFKWSQIILFFFCLFWVLQSITLLVVIFCLKVKLVLLPNKGLLVLLLSAYFSEHHWNFSSNLREVCPSPKENGISVNQIAQGSLQTDGRVLLLFAFELLPRKASTHRKALFEGHLFVFSLNGGVVVHVHTLNNFCFLKNCKEVLPNWRSKNNTHCSEWISVSISTWHL